MNQSFPEKLKSLRVNANLKQSELANILNVTQASISCYEKGTRQPDFNLVSKMANYFNVTVDYLINDNQIIIRQNPTVLSNKEGQLIDIFRNLSPSDQSKITEIARTLLKLSENK